MINLSGLQAFKEGRSHSQGGTNVQQWDFLHDYYALITCQIYNNRFGDAMKTFKKIKYFKLDSTNATDVFEKVKASNLFESFHELTSHTILQKIMQLCTSKCQALYGQADFVNCHIWSCMTYEISKNIQKNFFIIKGKESYCFTE